MVEFGGAIQVNCNNYTDDIRDIIGIPLSDEILERFCIPKHIIAKNHQIDIISRNDKIYVSSSILNKPIYIEYLHQLQNLVSGFMGIEIIDHKKFRI